MRQPTFDDKGVPFCDEERCPSFDGKRCEELGYPPSSVCEPEVRSMAKRLKAYQKAQAWRLGLDT